MDYLLKILLRDFKHHWVQFLSVFIMATLSLTIFAGMGAVWTGMEESNQDYFNKTNLCDGWVLGSNITNEDIKEMEALSCINSAAGSMLFSTNQVSDDTNSDIRLVTFSTDTRKVMNPLLRNGEKMDAATNGIWIDEDYAIQHNLQSGDVIKLEIPSISALIGKKYEVELPIAGIVLHSEYIYYVTSSGESMPDHTLHGYGFISEEYAKELFPIFDYNQIRYKITPETDKNEIEQAVKEILGNRLYSISERKDNPVIWQTIKEEKQIRSMALMFSAVFILLSLLTMYTTMSRLVNNQINLIGTLKALGFSNRRIYFHYSLYGFFVTLLGGILGVFLGMGFVSNLVLNVKKSTLTLPEWHLSLAPEAVYLILAIVLICTFASVITVRKVVSHSPADTINGRITEKRSPMKPGKRATSNDYEWRWVRRDILQNKVRYMIGVIAVMGSLVLMVAGVGVKDSIDASNKEIYQEQYSYTYMAGLNAPSFDVIKKDFDIDHVQYVSTQNANFSFISTIKSGTITILDEGDYISLKNLSGDDLSLPDNGIVISRKIASTLGVSIGDTISCNISGNNKTFEFEIKELTSAKTPQGILLSRKAWELAYQQNFLPNCLYLSGDIAYHLVKDSDYTTSIISIEKQRENIKILMKSVNTIVYILILASFLLSAVILYNLGELNYEERYRQYATMKVLGFYEKEIRSLSLRDSFLTVLPGYIIGIPISLMFLKVYIGIVSFDNIEWTAYIPILHYIIISIIVITFSIGINYFIMRKVKKVDMVEALKSVD